MARFLFVLPRFHTNALPWVRILRGAGHQVSIHVLRASDVEDHRDVSPRILARSSLGKGLAAIMPRKEDPDYYATPGFADYWRVLRDCAPDVVVVRGISRYAFRIVALAARLQGRRLVVYDQEDAQPKRGTTTWIRRAALAWAGIPHFTVRRYPGTPPRDRALALTIPFGAPRASSEMYRGAAERIERPVDVPRIVMVGKYRPPQGARRTDPIAGRAGAALPVRSLVLRGRERARRRRFPGRSRTAGESARTAGPDAVPRQSSTGSDSGRICAAPDSCTTFASRARGSLPHRGGLERLCRPDGQPVRHLFLPSTGRRIHI